MFKEKAIIQTVQCFSNSRKSLSSQLKAYLMVAAMVTTVSTSLYAGPLNWLKSKVSRSSNKRTHAISSPRVQVAPVFNLDNRMQSKEVLTGQNLDAYTFAQSHWSHSKTLLSSMCKTLVRKTSDPKIRDITKKLFVIDTQGFKETVKTFALAMKGIDEQNKYLRQQLIFLNQIVSAPQQETLEELEKSISNLWQINNRQAKVVKKYMRGAEGLISLGSQSYETLELIPSLSGVTLDLFVQTSKRLMKQMQSNGEAFKGLLLNIQNGNEQISSTLGMIRNTVKSSLRFSDHFAIKQFPLINLPTPSREKIFVQLKSLKNTIRGIANTISIGNSQIRNSSQQFAHLIQGLTAKATESFKYGRQNDGGDQEIAQISLYAQNQISGLFQRTKEILRATHMNMAKAMSDTETNSAPPTIGVETKSDYMAKRSMSVSQKQLPLFLLGGKRHEGNKPIEMIAQTRKHSDRDSENTDKLSSMLLYSENEIPKVKDNSQLMSSEMNILQEELGQNFFFSDSDAQPEADQEQNKNNINSDEQEITVADDYSDDEPLMQVSYDNLNSQPEPEIELLKFDAISDEEDDY